MAKTNIMTSQLYPYTCNCILAGIACAKALASLGVATPLNTDPEALLKLKRLQGSLGDKKNQPSYSQLGFRMFISINFTVAMVKTISQLYILQLTICCQVIPMI